MIEVDIVTPTKKLSVGVKANSVTLPTAMGEIQVLPGHEELITLLSVGVMRVETDKEEEKYVVSYGFAVVRNDKLLVLAETCEPASEINLERAKKAQLTSEKALEEVLTGENLRKYQLKLQRSIIRQQAVQS
jgi:F-type H+-transporting ATPase subunit epsilon